MNVNQIYCDDHFAKYTNTKSCCIPETNIILSQLYLKNCQKTSIKKNNSTPFSHFLLFHSMCILIYV